MSNRVKHKKGRDSVALFYFIGKFSSLAYEFKTYSYALKILSYETKKLIECTALFIQETNKKA